MQWNKVENEDDIEQLMKAFGGFHDGCIREIHIWTETYVADDLAMACPDHLDCRLRMLLQRQWANPSAIELLFEQVVGFCLRPQPEGYPSYIDEAMMKLEQGIFLWSDNFDENDEYEGMTWIRSKQLSWRNASEWMGDQLRYGAGGTAQDPESRLVPHTGPPVMFDAAAPPDQ